MRRARAPLPSAHSPSSQRRAQAGGPGPAGRARGTAPWGHRPPGRPQPPGSGRPRCARRRCCLPPASARRCGPRTSRGPSRSLKPAAKATTSSGIAGAGMALSANRPATAQRIHASMRCSGVAPAGSDATASPAARALAVTSRATSSRRSSSTLAWAGRPASAPTSIQATSRPERGRRGRAWRCRSWAPSPLPRPVMLTLRM